MEKKRSVGITILSVTEIILGLAGVIFVIWALIPEFNTKTPYSSPTGGWAFFIAIIAFLLSLPLFIAGVLTFLLKPAGRILSIIAIAWVSLSILILIPIGVVLIIYLFRADIKEQFRR